MIEYDDFAKVDMRVGRVIEVEDFERARKPSYKVKVDLGPDIGIKSSSVQAKNEYKKKDLLNKEIIAVVNFPPRNIAGFMSEVLLLGVPCKDGSLSLLEPSRKPVRIGGKVF
jgi:tRNA-binding protein